MQREREERLEGKMMFWGKVNGNENDYLVCYALATPALEEGDFPLKKVTLPQRKNPNKHGQKPIRLLCRGPCAAKRRCLVVDASVLCTSTAVQPKMTAMCKRGCRIYQRSTHVERTGWWGTYLPRSTRHLDWSNRFKQRWTYNSSTHMQILCPSA